MALERLGLPFAYSQGRDPDLLADSLEVGLS